VVHNLVREELAPYGEQAAALDFGWGDRAGMWFTEVQPTNPAAAHISIAVQDSKTITATVGNIWFEMFGPVSKNLPTLRQIVAGVLAGRLEESGSERRAFGRVNTADRNYRLGHLHSPWPWKLRHPRRYEAYGPVL
jgi:hypothetical protein